MNMGFSPVMDTMTDIIAAVLGVLAFYGCLMVDKLSSHRFVKNFTGYKP